MAKKKRKSNPRPSLASLARSIDLLRSEVRTNSLDLKELRAEMHSGFDQMYRHIDGFIKLHETLDIEMQVMKAQMKRLEERVERLETS
jgi:uncharacterized protein (UPF0335 family)